MIVQIVCGRKLHLTGELFGDFLCPRTALGRLHFLQSGGALSEVAVGLTSCLWLRLEVVCAWKAGLRVEIVGWYFHIHHFPLLLNQ